MNVFKLKPFDQSIYRSDALAGLERKKRAALFFPPRGKSASEKQAWTIPRLLTMLVCQHQLQLVDTFLERCKLIGNLLLRLLHDERVSQVCWAEVSLC